MAQVCFNAYCTLCRSFQQKLNLKFCNSHKQIRSVRKTRGKWNVGQFGLEVNVRRASCAPFLQSFHPLVLTLQAWWSSFSHKSSNGNFAFPFDLSCIWCTWLVGCVLLNPQSEPFAISLVCMKVFVCAYISMCHYLTEIDNCCNRS